MRELELDFDPFANDPGHWGASLANLAEIIFPCLETVAPRSVVEVGAYAGDLTGLLVQWGSVRGTVTIAIDPAPQDELIRLADDHSELELIEHVSLVALRQVPVPDVVILDGDHNYYTVSEELRLIEGRAAEAGGSMPLVMLHDVAWPHARRDTYHAPQEIPAEHRQPLVEGPGLFPGVQGVRPGGLPFHWAARTEGGARNGVLTAAEDFVGEREGIRLAVVPAFFGLGMIWRLDAPWSDALSELLDPFDRNPMLQRLEENRVLHLAASHFQMVEAAHHAQRNASKEELLRELLKSNSFALAELVSRIRQRGRPAFSKDWIRRVLAE